MGPNLSDDFNRSVGTGRKWFDCAECHAEQENHPLLQTVEMVRSKLYLAVALPLMSLTDFCLQEVQESI